MTASPIPQPRGGSGIFLPRLEALRGFGALAVAWGHSIAITYYAIDVEPGRWGRIVRLLVSASAWIFNGRAALILFFLISGLVLSLMLDAAAARGPLRGYAAFVFRRALRIYPAHWAALALFVPVAALTLFRWQAADPAALAALPPNPRWWFDGTIYGHPNPTEMLRTAALYDEYYNSVTWSLRVELQACLVVPLFAWLSRHGRLWIDLPAVAILVAAASLVDTDRRPDAVFLYLPAFYAGAMARTWGPRIAAALAARRGATSAALILSYLVLCLPAAIGQADRVRLWLVLDMTLGGFGLVMLCAWARLGRIDVLFLHPFSRWMGRISYSFYLWHWLAMNAAGRVLILLLPGPELIRWSLPLFFTVAAASIGAAMAAAAASWRWIERPSILAGRSIGARIAGGPPRQLQLPVDAEAATAP